MRPSRPRRPKRKPKEEAWRKIAELKRLGIQVTFEKHGSPHKGRN
jgi:hypothetical protein